VSADDANLFSFRRNLVLAASAGTGKTHALVGVVVHLLLGATASQKEIDPSKIVATTFSRKAAAEMRARLTRELERLALGDPTSAYRDSLMQGANIDARALRDRARKALARSGDVTIGTLHGFATRLLREHALEAGVAPAFDLLDETESRARAERTICQVLAEASIGEGDAVRDLVQVAGGVLEAARQIARAISRIEEDGRPADLLELDVNEAAELDAQMIELAQHARALSSDDRFEVAARAIGNRLEKSRDPDFDATAFTAHVAAMFSVRKTSKTSADAAFFSFRDSLKVSGTNSEKASRFVQTWLLRDRFHPRAVAFRELVAACDARVREDRRSAGVLAFSDVLRTLRELLVQRPDVAAQIGSRLDALLVDEFQDTSRVQRDIVALLWERSPRDREPGIVPTLDRVRGEGLLVVGDRKQSIYGFRGASVAVFAESCVLLAGEAARDALAIDRDAVRVPADPTADFIALRHNRRAHAELLAFANVFSDRRLNGSGKDLDEIRYSPSAENLLPPPESPKRTIADPSIFWLRPPIERNATDRLSEAFAVAARIAKVLAEGKPLVSNRPPTPRDIAVLSMTNEMLDAVAYALADRKIPYVVAGRGFFSAREVKDAIAMLRLLVDRADGIALAEVFRGPWCGLDDVSLMALADGPRGLHSIETVLARSSDTLITSEDRQSVERLSHLVIRLRDQMDRANTGDLLEQAIRACDLEETLVQLPRGEQRVANVRKLVEIAREFSGSAHLLVQRFAEAVEQAASETEAATFSDEDDAVRLCTVHASKGLAFPIVFMPEVARGGRRPDFPTLLVDVGSGVGPSSLSVRLPTPDGSRVRSPAYARACDRIKLRERSEQFRLAYVAVTRAAEALFFVGDRNPPKTGTNDAYEGSTVSVLASIADDEALRERLRFVVEHVEDQRGGDSFPLVAREISESVDRPKLSWSHAGFAVTALADFHVCPRRYELVHLLMLPERDLPRFAIASAEDTSAQTDAPRVDALSEGSLAHRVLEHVSIESFGSPDAQIEIADLLTREGIDEAHGAHELVSAKITRFLRGKYASRIAREGATLIREQPFVLSLKDSEARSVLLRGAIDLLVTWPDGSIDVLDYKRARGPDAEVHAFQLDVYALAARDMFPEATTVRSGILFLGGDPSEPSWHVLPEPRVVRERIVRLGAQAVSARQSQADTNELPRVAIATCKSIHCGYVTLCHPAPASNNEKQLDLFSR
jgi:ATP-dependent helicase/nuclease subunit A